MTSILLPILTPLAALILVVCIKNSARGVKEIVSTIAALVNLIVAIMLFKTEAAWSLPWVGGGIELSLRIYQFSAFIILAIAVFGLLITLYSSIFMAGHKHAKQFFVYLLLSLALANGAVLADNLIAMLFFWEGLLITLFAMIAVGNQNAFKTATKAFVIIGICDLTMMAGIALSGHLAGTLTLSKMHVSATGLGALAFIFLMIGAISKAGSMPFHSWIPDAAIDAPLPFMAILPASLEKLLGIYFLTRITLDIFALDPKSWMSPLLMIIGSITILLAVMMALVQKDYKRLLSYHAISQVGYMILGIGTLVPAGIVGGLFHMINHAMYKSCLFLTGGSVEKQTGTTDLEKLGGLASKMPITFACFVIAAASISGVPPFNGFFSKELVYDGALERGMLFYVAAVLGSFLTAASFLKLGHAAFLGARRKEHDAVKEAPIAMLIPMISIAAICVIFGLWNALPLRTLIQPILGSHRLEGLDFAGWPTNTMIVIVTVVVLIAAYLNHLYGVKKTGKGISAADHIHYAPVLSTIYEKAEARAFDPYDIGRVIIKGVTRVTWTIDRSIDWCYSTLSTNIAYLTSAIVRQFHNGCYCTYIAWSIAAGAIIIYFLFHPAAHPLGF